MPILGHDPASNQKEAGAVIIEERGLLAVML
jgi:hypothetical protein